MAPCASGSAASSTPRPGSADLPREALRPGGTGGGRPRAFVERIYRALPHVPLPIVRAMAAVGHGFMQSAQLRGIKHRAEAHSSL